MSPSPFWNNLPFPDPTEKMDKTIIKTFAMLNRKCLENTAVFLIALLLWNNNPFAKFLYLWYYFSTVIVEN